MTFKKSMISISAAAVIAASLTGCGSSNSSGGGNLSGIQSSVTAVDGYVRNAKVEAYYTVTDDNNVTTMAAPITLASASDSSKDPATAKWTDGSSVYSLPADANDTVKKGLKFFKLSFKDSVPSTATTPFYPATYLEDGTTVGSDGNDTAWLNGEVMYAPANSAILSPLSSMIYQATKDQLGSENAVGSVVVDLNTSFMTSLESNASKIADVLGLSGVNLLTADPIKLMDSKPEFALVNAALKNAPATVATQLLAATKPATESLQNTLQALSDAGQATGLITALLQQVKTGAFKASDISGMALDKSVKADVITNAVVADNDAKFQITDMNMTATLSLSDLINSGDKINKNAITPFVTIETENDVNISNKSFTLLLKLAGGKDFVSDSGNTNSGGLVVSVPFDMNSTEGVIAYNLPDTNMVKYEVRTNDGSEIVSKEFNASVIDVNSGFTFAQAATTGTGTLTLNIGTIMSAVASSADANTTASYAIDQGINAVQAILVDNNSAAVRVISGNNIGFPEATIAGIAGGITGNGINLINNPLVDLRTAGTANNLAPNNTIAIATADVTYDTNASTNDIVIPANTAVTVGVNASTVDNHEKNTTAVFTLGTGLTDGNLTTVSKLIKLDSSSDTADVANGIEANATVDTFTTLKVAFADEFNESNTTTYQVMINAAPKASASAYATTDTNGTGFMTSITFTNMQESNNTVATYAASDAEITIDNTVNSNTGIVTDANITDGKLYITLGAGAGAGAVDSTITVKDPVGNVLETTVDINVTIN